MGTITCKPHIRSSRKLTEVLTHFGLKEGDHVSATHALSSKYNYVGSIRNPGRNGLTLGLGDFMYTSITAPSLPTFTINPGNPCTWPPSVPRIYTMAEIEAGVLPLGTRLLGGHANQRSDLKYHFVVARGTSSDRRHDVRIGVIQCTSDFIPHGPNLREMSAANPGDFHTILFDHPKVLSGTTASVPSTPEATKEPPPMKTIARSVIALKSAPTEKNPNATIEITLEGPTLLNEDNNDLAPSVQAWIMSNIPLIQEKGAIPGTIQIQTCPFGTPYLQNT